MLVWSLGQEDPLEEEMSTHSSILAWKVPRTEEPGRLQSKGSQRVGHKWATSGSEGIEVFLFVAVVQLLNHVPLCATPWIAAHQASLSFTISLSLLKLMSFEWVIPSNYLILCHPLLLPSIFPSIMVFPVSWLFESGCQNIGASALASVLPTNIQDWFPLGWTGLISLLSKGLSGVFSSNTVQNHQFFSAQPSLCPTPTSVHDYWKNHSFDYLDLARQSDVSVF